MLFTRSGEQKSVDSFEQKAHDVTVIGHETSFPEFLLNSGNADLSAYAAIKLYIEAMPFFNAVDMRATAFSEIAVRLFDTKKNEYVQSHPVLDLLKAPNADVSQTEFLHALSSFYDITGEAFVVATGRVNQKPLELMTCSPAFASFGACSSRYGMLTIPENIALQPNGLGQTVFNSQDVKGKLRFQNTRQDQELWHLRSFNPNRSGGNFRGLSRAKPLWLELQQYVSGNRSNLSTLKRGTRLSMAWINTGATELTNTQWERMQQEAQKYAGEANVGGTPILDGMDVKTIQQTNRDMEFGSLQDKMLSRCSNVFQIPLALLLDSVMTLSNLETAVMHLYDLAVLPHANRIYDELTRFLMPRYPDSENLVLKYNENDIPAVRSRLVEMAKRRKEIGVNTTNELREIIGDQAISDTNADTVLIPAGQIPLSYMSEPVAPAAPSVAVEEPVKSAFEQYGELMRKCVDSKGERIYSEAFIVSMALEQGLLNGD